MSARPCVAPGELTMATYNNGEMGTGRVYCFRHVEDLRRVMVENGDGVNPNHSWFRSQSA